MQTASRALVLTGLGQYNAVRTPDVLYLVKDSGSLRIHAVPFRFETVLVVT
ncbi:MAG: hypothetical protein WCW66_03650 [Patescibacteria group bacterium]